MKFFLGVVIAFMTTAESTKAADLPDYLLDLKCPVDDNLKECILKNANLAIPLVARGDPDYDIPKMNPIDIKFLNIISTPHVNLNFTNFKLYGLETLRLQEVKIKMKEGIQMYTNILKGDNITADGQYSVDGKLLVMPLKGKGHFTISLKNGIYTTTTTIITEERDGDTYLKPLDTRFDSYKFDRITFQLDNLFDGNEQLGKKVNDFLNDNWDLILDDFGPGIAEVISRYIEHIFEGFCSKVPVKNIWIHN